MKQNSSVSPPHRPGFWPIGIPSAANKPCPAHSAHYLLAALIGCLLVLGAAETHAATYTVKPGDTLWRIAQTHNVSVEALQKANNMGDSGVVIIGHVMKIPGATSPAAPATSPPHAAAAPAAGNTGQHVVQRGETLYSIATQYRTTVATLRQINELPDDAVLVSGRTLRVPAGSQPLASTPVAPPGPGAIWHEVQRGETLSALSRRYGVSLTQLETWNQMSRDAPLIAGARLRVGGGDGLAVAESNPATPAVPKNQAPPASEQTYTVVRGDTLSAIARAHNVRVTELAAVNQIPTDFMVKINQELKLPLHAAVPPAPVDVTDNTRPPGAPAITTAPAEVAVADPVETGQPEATESAPSQQEVVSTTPEPEPVIADDTAQADATETLDDFFSYEIQPEQSLAEVAEIFFTTEAELMRINPRVKTAGQARAGDRILVPGKGLKKRFASQF